jgi:Relaxase/Mobilisation nuclease domain
LARYKGHEAIIKTHTDTGKIHNHIVVNMVNHETGKMLENKKYHLHKLRDLNDKICLANGLSVINREAKERRARLPDKVLRMERFNRFSYIFDTKQKADFARKYATGYDEYVAILGQLGVAARVENKNITYYYPGIERV